MASNWRIWIILAFWLSIARLTEQTPIKICMGKNFYEYELGSCPGGIQLRDIHRWLSKSREKACICGNGTVLQFDGEDKTPVPDIYPMNYPDDRKPFQGSFYAYNLNSGCEKLLGNQPSALFIDMKYFEDPDNFPHRPLELLVSPTEHKRLVGSYRWGIFNGRYSKVDVGVDDYLKTIMLNTRDPVVITPDGNGVNNQRYCAHSTKPEVILVKYRQASWVQPSEETSPNCGGSSYPPYLRPRGSCKSSCITSNGSSETSAKEGGAIQFQKLFETMGEISLRLKYSKKEIIFGNTEAHVTILQKSCRVFYRAFPNVIKWETLMNAVTLFGISFEGLIPSKMEKEALDHIKIALSRCALEQSRQRDVNDALYKKICAKKGNGTGSGGSDNFKGYNKLIELLWQIVQFVQAKCLPSSDHYPNVHHFYGSAMIELFSSPTIQLLWHQNPQTQDAVNRAMLHIFPELPDHALGTIEEILKQMDYQIYFSILQRPKIKRLEERDMRCAGHGKIIWGGKACCYLEEDDKKYYFYNRVSFAKL